MVLMFVLLGGLILKSRSRPHHVRVAFTEAVLLNAGLDAKIDGVDAGKIDKVEYQDGRAVVTLGVDDDVWPLRQGTRARVRWGTTVGSGTRWVELTPGPRNAPAIPEDGIIDIVNTRPAVELDQVLDTFDERTRSDVRRTAKGVGASLRGRGADLNRGLRAAPAAIQSVGDVMGELASDTDALRGLVANGNRFVGTLAARSGQVADLVTVASATFDAFASRSTGVEQSISQLAPTLRRARSLLARLDTSVDGLDPLFADLRPGAARLRPLAAVARPALRELRATVPPALATVRTATAAAPRVTSLLKTAVPFAGDLEKVVKPLQPRLACLRPYTPEAAGLLVNGSGWVAGYTRQPAGPPGGAGGRISGAAGGRDGGGLVRQHYARVHVLASSTSFHSYPGGIRSDLFAKATGKSYALLRPPGWYARQPQYMPECGYTQAGVDASKDPEDLPLDQRQPWEKVR